VVPALGIVEAANHVDAVCGDHEATVVEIVLLGREHVDRRAWLLPGIRQLLETEKSCRR
jgi:hypothetical protein